MSATANTARRAERIALWCGCISGVCAVALSAAAPGSVAVAYRLAFFACLAPALGCTFLVLLHRITGGQWTNGIGPMLLSGNRMTPWVWVLAVPMLFMGRRPDGAGYDSLPVLALRLVVYGALFFGVRWALADDVGVERDARKNARPWVGSVGMIVLFFALTLLADDWIESLEPEWHSTAFAAVWIVGLTVSGLSLCVLFALGGDAAPGQKGSASRSLGNDWGNLLLSAAIFFTYVAFAQFLIIWAGNLPHEISWYLERERGAWLYVIPALALTGFAAPFGILLSIKLKDTVAGLAWASALLLGSQLGYMVWVVAPAQHGSAAMSALLDAAFLACGGGFFINRFAAGIGARVR
ncbi:MAG TPA: hypothetical protein VGG34_01850 [Opitutaceae bacterium]|jgi:hypothetical protein